MITVAGYMSEIHRVETQDGFMLKLHRLLPKGSFTALKKGPVLLIHGLFGTAADFVLSGPEIALGE